MATTNLNMNTNVNARPALFSSTAAEITVVMSLSMATAMNAIAQGLLTLALPTISRDFNITGGNLTWIIASGSITSGSFLLLLGTLADLLGRKKMLLFSYAWFAVWSLAQGFAKGDILFDVFRGISGIGTAGAIPAAVGILGSVYPSGQRRNKVFACFGAFQPMGFVVGTLVGGLFTQFVSWRANLWFLAGVYAVIAVLVYFYVPSDKVLSEHSAKREVNTNHDSTDSLPEEPTTLALLKKVDFVGAGMITVGFALLVFALTQAGLVPGGWASAEILSTLLISILLIALFVAWEYYMGARALMPLSIWTYPNFGLIMIIMALAWMNFSGVVNFFSTIWFQKINGTTPILTSAYFLPQPVAGTLVNVFAAYTLHIIPGKILLSVGLLGFTGSALLFALQPVHMIYWAMSFPSLICSVIGADLCYMVANLFVTQSVPDRLKSTAGGVFNTVIVLGSTIGLGAGAAISDSVKRKVGEGDKEFLARGIRAADWFAVGVTIVAAGLSLFLSIGTTGHEELNHTQDGGVLSEAAEIIPAVLGGADGEREKSVVTEVTGERNRALNKELGKEVV